jgi:hypothetical protein
MYLTPLAVGSAELTVGGIDDTKFSSKGRSHWPDGPLIAHCRPLNLCIPPFYDKFNVAFVIAEYKHKCENDSAVEANSKHHIR